MQTEERLHALDAVRGFALIAGVVWWIIGQLPLPAPFMQIAQVVFAVIILLVLLGMLFGTVSVPTLRL